MEEKRGFIFFMVFILTFFLVATVSNSTIRVENNKKSSEPIPTEAILPKPRKKDTVDPILEDELDLPRLKRNFTGGKRSAPMQSYP